MDYEDIPGLMILKIHVECLVTPFHFLLLYNVCATYILYLSFVESSFIISVGFLGIHKYVRDTHSLLRCGQVVL